MWHTSADPERAKRERDSGINAYHEAQEDLDAPQQWHAKANLTRAKQERNSSIDKVYMSEAQVDLDAPVTFVFNAPKQPTSMPTVHAQVETKAVLAAAVEI